MLACYLSVTAWLCRCYTNAVWWTMVVTLYSITRSRHLYTATYRETLDPERFTIWSGVL